MIYPYCVQIETTTACNGRCSFCPHSRSKPVVQMPDKVIEGIISQMSEWDDHPKVLCPFLTNEPLADSRIFDICDEINRRLPTTELVFFTNGSLLDELKLKKLLSLKNIESVHLSLHECDPVSYKNRIGLDFNATVRNIKRLVESDRYFKVEVLRVSDKSGNGKFAEYVAKEFPKAVLSGGHQVNWIGAIDSQFKPIKSDKFFCPRHTQLCITADGKIPLCCLDSGANYGYGNISDGPLLELFNDKRRIERIGRPAQEIHPCELCNVNLG